MFYFVNGFFACVSYVFASTTISPGCKHHNITYQVGESFSPTPCELCFCFPDGRTPCTIADCLFTPCVDPVQDQTKCCPTCPNEYEIVSLTKVNTLKTVMISLLCVLFALVSTSLASTTASPGCTYRGKTYKVNESFQPTPCEHCFCSPDGRTPCAIADCFFTPCADAVHDPTKCCPTCPNGENCQHPDGTLIKKGEVYHPDSHTVCKCPTTSFHFGAPVAMCATSITDTVQTVS